MRTNNLDVGLWMSNHDGSGCCPYMCAASSVLQPRDTNSSSLQSTAIDPAWPCACIKLKHSKHTSCYCILWYCSVALCAMFKPMHLCPFECVCACLLLSAGTSMPDSSCGDGPVSNSEQTLICGPQFKITSAKLSKQG